MLLHVKKNASNSWCIGTWNVEAYMQMGKFKKKILKEVDTVHSLFVTHEGQMAKTRSSRDGKNI